LSGIALVGHSLKRYRWTVIFMSLLLALFQILIVLVARTLSVSEAFGYLSALVPDFVKQVLGPTVPALLSFNGLVCVGYLHVAVVGSILGLVIALATETTQERESGFVDLVMSRPLSRKWLIYRSGVALIACVSVILISMVLGTVVGLRWLAPEDYAGPRLEVIGGLASNLWALMLSWGGIALAVAAYANRRGSASALVGFLAVATYLLDFLARMWQPAASIAWLSPFHYFTPLDILLGAGIRYRDFWVHGGIALTGFAIACRRTSQRDL